MHGGSDLYINGEKLETVVFPRGMHETGRYQFAGCNSIRNVTLPDDITVIGEGTFYYCKKLSTIQLSSMLKSIGSHAFEGCKSLSHIDLPKTTVQIGDSAFKSSGLAAIHLPSGLNDIAKETFMDCKLTQIEIPEGIKCIGRDAFNNCADLTEVSFPASLKTIDEFAFCFCDKIAKVNIKDLKAWLKTEIRFPPMQDATLYIDGKKMERFTLPKDVDTIPEHAFQGCNNISEVKIPEHVKRIERDAFSGCKTLKRVEIPRKTEIGVGAFSYCKQLEEVILSDGVKDLPGACFTSCKSLKNIVLPGSIKSIQAGCFKGCRNLSSVTLSEGIETIEVEAFERCTSLKEIELPASVRSVGARLECSKVTFHTFFDNIENAFKKDTTLCIPDKILDSVRAAYQEAKIYNLKGKLIYSKETDPDNYTAPKFVGAFDLGLKPIGSDTTGFSLPKFENKEIRFVKDKLQYRVVFKGAGSANNYSKLVLSILNQKELKEKLYDVELLRRVNRTSLYEDYDTRTLKDGSGCEVNYPEELTPDEMRQRMSSFVDRLAVTLTAETLSKVIDILPHKKNGMLYNGKKSTLMKASFSDHQGMALVLIAKNTGDIELELSVKKAYIADMEYKKSDFIAAFDALVPIKKKPEEKPVEKISGYQRGKIERQERLEAIRKRMQELLSESYDKYLQGIRISEWDRDFFEEAKKQYLALDEEVVIEDHCFTMNHYLMDHYIIRDLIILAGGTLVDGGLVEDTEYLVVSARAISSGNWKSDYKAIKKLSAETGKRKVIITEYQFCKAMLPFIEQLKPGALGAWGSVKKKKKASK